MTDVDWVSLDGELVPAEDARVSVFDAALLYGAGLFETMRIARRWVVDRDRHLARLESSARTLGLTVPPADRLRDRIEQWRERTQLRDGRVRLTITAGSIAGGSRFEPREPVTLVMGSPRSPAESERFRRGVTAGTTRFDGGSLAGHKTTSYLPWWLASRARRDVEEILLVDTSDSLLEGASSNVFAVIDGVVRTPPVRDRALAGVTRRRLLELADEARWPVQEQPVGLDELRRCDELWLTQSIGGVVPVVKLDGELIGKGAPGPWTLRALELYEGWLSRESS